MKAKIIETRENAKNLGNSKEMVDTYNVIALTKKGLKNIVTCRCYMGRSNSASTVFASIWVHGKVYTSGYGYAGGYGYHKVSAAIADAISSAGIKLDKSIHGVGDSAVEEALIAIENYKDKEKLGKKMLVNMLNEKESINKRTNSNCLWLWRTRQNGISSFKNRI